jgi:hypothetical protein
MKNSYSFIKKEHCKELDTHVLMKIAYILEIHRFSYMNKPELARSIMVAQDDENRFLYHHPSMDRIRVNEEVNIWEYLNKGNKYKKGKERSEA